MTGEGTWYKEGEGEKKKSHEMEGKELIFYVEPPTKAVSQQSNQCCK